MNLHFHPLRKCNRMGIRIRNSLRRATNSTIPTTIRYCRHSHTVMVQGHGVADAGVVLVVADADADLVVADADVVLGQVDQDEWEMHHHQDHDRVQDHCP
jgi:hypothetical protein